MERCSTLCVHTRYVDRILGEPLLVYDDILHDYVEGYEYDPDWTIVIDYVGKGGDLPNSEPAACPT